MKITMTQRALILRATRYDNVACGVVASRFAIPYRIVEAVHTGKDNPNMYVSPQLPETEDHRENGRPELREFMIAKKAPDALWPYNNGLIAQTQREYDAGKVEMCQGRSSKWIFLYRIPRKIPKSRINPYFTRDMGA